MQEKTKKNTYKEFLWPTVLVLIELYSKLPNNFFSLMQWKIFLTYICMKGLTNAIKLYSRFFF